MGGYVKFKKRQFDVEFGEGEKVGEKLSPGRWFWICVAGPLANFVLTAVIFSSMMFYTVSNTMVGKNAAGEKILAVDVQDSSLRQNFLGVEKTGTNFVLKDGKYVPYTLTPEDKLAIPSLSNRLLTAAVVGPVFISYGSVATLKGLGGIVSSKEGYKNLMGPVGIAGEADKARSTGVVSLLFIIATLSFAVGFFNLLPLAFLDGGRALMAVYEGVSRRTISLRALGLMNTISLILILNLLVVGLFSDFMRIWNK